MQPSEIPTSGWILAQNSRSRIQEANLESWGYREPFVNSTSTQILIGLVVSSRKEDLRLRLLIWAEEVEGGGADTWHSILGVLWGKAFVSPSKGKMLLVFPSVLQKGYLTSAMIFDKLSKSLGWLGSCQSIFLSPHTKLFNSSYFNNPNNKKIIRYSFAILNGYCFTVFNH